MALSEEIAGVIATEVNKHLDPFTALMKDLEGPAKRAGLAPLDYMQKMTQGGRRDGIFDPSGNFRQVTPAMLGPTKAIGWGGTWRDLAICADKNNSYDAMAAAANRLNKSATEGGHGGAWCDKDGQVIEKAALAEGAGATGGYLVAPEMSRNMLSIAAEGQSLAPRCSKQPIAGKSILVPSLDHTGATAGQSPFLGGLVAKWTSEAASRDESEPTFRQTELTAWELSFYVLASNNLLADNATGLDSFLTTLFGMAIDWYSEYAFFQGDGVGKPLGILNSAPLISVSRLATNRVSYTDVATMEARLLAASSDRAVYFAHQSIKKDLLLMHDLQGNQTTYGAGQLVFADVLSGATKKMPDTLLGRPIYYTEKLPKLGAAGDLLLVDPFFYLLGTRMEIEIAVSAHAAFRNNQMAYRVVWRGDGRPWLGSSITLADGTHTVSPFVAIAA